VDAHWTFWTLTVWEDENAMRTFRGSGAHSQVMPRLAEWCDEASYAHWTSPDDAVPMWQRHTNDWSAKVGCPVWHIRLAIMRRDTLPSLV